MNDCNDLAVTWVAQMTPVGAAAIATLSLRGPRVWEYIAQLVDSGTALPPLREITGSRFWLARIGSQGPIAGDKMVVALVRTGHCLWVDLHCHGGVQVARALLEALVACGARECSWQELERRTSVDAFASMARVALAEALTVRTGAVLLDQLHGALGRAVRMARTALAAAEVIEARRVLGGLVIHVPLGLHLTRPWRVAVLGAANVGKSSLINAIAGYERSIVAETPGTTRDVVSLTTAVDGWPVEFLDTAGWRDGGSELEQEGIRRAENAAVEADLRLWVVDRSLPPAYPPPEIGAVCHVINKADLPAAWDDSRMPGALRVSARTGENVEQLLQRIVERLIPAVPAPGEAVPFTPALCARIRQAAQYCEQGDYEAAYWLLERAERDLSDHAES